MSGIKVVELFAGVGGFRIGLEGYNGKSSLSNYKDDIKSPYKVVLSNQWEPNIKKQYASLVYENRFGSENHINDDINNIDITTIPDHDLLVGGFPCQDYSVASSTKNSKGLVGKKGVLWWSIHKILSEKESKPKYLMLENVDRLLISPSKQRGRDFAIILKSLNDLDYIVEWRVINAADYGMPQRRKRTFILAYLKDTKIYNDIVKIEPKDWLISNGTLSDAFPITSNDTIKQFTLNDDIIEISNNFNKDKVDYVFKNSGIIINNEITTLKVTPNYSGNFTLLKDIIETENIPDEYYIREDIDKWYYLKGSKKKIRTSKDGYEYTYSEGKMGFPDDLNKPSRTIITGEGGNAPSRFKHVIDTPKGLRRLLPLELERLNMFPDNHTQLKDVSDTKRAFFMGNALVIGIVEKIGKSLLNKI